MKKITALLITLLFVAGASYSSSVKGPFGYDLEADIHRDVNNKNVAANEKKSSSEDTEDNVNSVSRSHADGHNAWESERSYYSNATLQSAINKYKVGNYSGSLQELISLTKKDPFNPVVYYYMGMAYTQVGNKQQAINAYEAVINMNASQTLTEYSIKGRDCLIGGPTCHPVSDTVSVEDDLDRFINAPYGNGFSDELNKQMKDKQLQDIKKRIEVKNKLEDSDIKKMRDFDRKYKGEAPETEQVAKSEVSGEDVLSAIETLKKAGVAVTVNPYQPAFPMNDEYAQLSMMLGTNNYNNNNNSMMNMLPLLMAQQNGGQKIDPQVIQSMMMSSMLPDFTFSDKKD